MDVLKRGLQTNTNFEFKHFIKFQSLVERALGNSFRQETITKFLDK